MLLDTRHATNPYIWTCAEDMQANIQAIWNWSIASYLVRFGDVVLASGTPRWHHGWCMVAVLMATRMNSVAVLDFQRYTAANVRKLPNAADETRQVITPATDSFCVQSIKCQKVAKCCC